ncbi:hypothetical protein LINPERHAP2_LOCUS38701 [Linum perenne]
MLSFSDDFWSKLCRPWINIVVVRLLGNLIIHAFICNRLRAIWKPVGHMHVVDLDKSCFMVKFSNEQDYYKALTGGPWLIFDHYLIVHQWDSSFRVSDNLPTKMVVWVRFPHVPIRFYHKQVLTSLRNLVSRMVKIDANTQRADSGKFARLAVEINLNEPLALVVSLDGVLQPVEYESIPNMCFGCGRVRHPVSDCPLVVAIVPEEVTRSSPTDPGVVTSQAGAPAPTKDVYGPWMIVTRRPGRARKESRTEKEGAKIVVSGVPLEERSVEAVKEGVSVKDQREIRVEEEKKEVVGSPDLEGAEKVTTKRKKRRNKGKPKQGGPAINSLADGNGPIGAKDSSAPSSKGDTSKPNKARGPRGTNGLEKEDEFMDSNRLVEGVTDLVQDGALEDGPRVA